MIRHYRNNEEGTAIVEHVEMTRAELDAALSVARETAYREAAEHALGVRDEACSNFSSDWFSQARLGAARAAYEKVADWLSEQAEAEARKRGEG